MKFSAWFRGVVLLSISTCGHAQWPGGDRGPNSLVEPYIAGAPTRFGNSAFKALLTVGAVAGKPQKGADNGYNMVGIPDGLGALDNGDTFTVFMNHELVSSLGTVRAHGRVGAFVSAWQIRKSDLGVSSGRDWIRKVFTGTGGPNGTQWVERTTAFNAFCSADLPPLSAFYNAKSGRGYNGRIFMNGEENGIEGRAFAHVVSGPEANTSYQLPSLGRAAWENIVAHPDTGDKTVVVGLDDSVPGRVYVYVGEKQSTGNAAQRAGLDNGTLYGVKVEGGPQNEDRIAGFHDKGFSLVAMTRLEASGAGAALKVLALAKNVTQFLRPEDGAWDTTNPNRFYFATTDRFDGERQVGASRLYALNFTDINNPVAGGTITLHIDGSLGGERVQMLDNITVASDGTLILLEDPSNEDHRSKVWHFNPVMRRLTMIGQHSAKFFGPGGSQFLTNNEEASGVIEITSFFVGVAGFDTSKYRYFLLTSQAHFGLTAELVEGGQLLLMAMPVR